MKKILTLILIVFCAATLFAQAPEKFSYQAVVRNATNQLVTNAPVSVRVSILQGSADGEALYVETQSAVTNANGLLTLEIGGGKAEQGAFDRIDWAGGPFFLKTETDPNGGSDYSITSVQQLLSVPYALYAKEAANGFSGDYNDLKNKPAIPQNVGELTNDAGYITLNDIPTPSKSGETNDAGVVQTTACGEIDLCDMASQLARLQAQFARQQAQMEETQTALLSTVDDSEPCPGTPTVKDIDGNVYNTVKIGEQCWMRENLRTTRYADGSHIPAGGSNTSTTDPYYYDFPSSGIPLEKRGYLYNWPAAMHGAEYSETNPSNVQGICPDGWHLPSNAEWTQLTDYVGNIPDYVCGDQNIIKALSDTSGWGSQYYGDSECGSCAASFNPSTNNATGFSALPTGLWYEGFSGGYWYEGFGGGDAWFWSTSFSSDGGGASFTMQFNCATFVMANEYVGEAGAGFSVRCLRGSATVEETSITVPSVTTSEVSDVSDVSAVCGGEVTADGGAEVTERGVCWGTEPNPTLEGSHTSNGTGTGEFVSTLTDLAPNTYYYVRAYAINSMGTVYGEVVSFNTTIIIPAGDAQPCPGNETVTDIDGNVYNTVKIGEQCWMKENLRVTHYADGVEIPLGSTPSFDVALVYYPADNANNVLTHGYLYNWAAVMHGMTTSNTNPSNVQGVCPTGWHVPSDAEWAQLTDYVGGESAYWCRGNGNNIAKALAAQTGWNINDYGCTVGDSQDANNATGFSALPAGLYSGFGYTYGGFDDYADFWSATQGSWSQASLFHISNEHEYVERYTNDKYDGKSVRCILGDGYNFAAVTTEEVTNVTLHRATCGGDVTYDGNTDVTERGVCWSTEPNPTLEDSHTSDGTGTGEFVSTLTDLTPNTTYYVKAYATNSVGTAYGEEVSFTTAEEEQQDTCTIVSLPYTENFDSYTTTTTATTGVEPACWELVQEDVAMTDANRPQLYYKSSYAHSGNYSLLLNYRGIYAMPVVSQQIPLNTLKMEMYLRQPRDYYQLQVGVWEDNGTFVPVATVHNASTGTEFVEVDFSGYTGDGGRIAFRNLNSNGNNYSYNYLDDITLSIIGGAVVDEKSCTGNEIVTDIDGNIYSTVQIGDQCWMRENLRTMHYADGTAIPAGGDNGSYTEPYYYDYSSHSLPLETRGYLYNWPAAMIACPAGWHLPSDAEWTQLTDYVGSQSEYTCDGNSDYIAKALASETGWNSSTSTCAVGNDPTSNNATGFSAVPTGYWYNVFNSAGNDVRFWSSTEGDGSGDNTYCRDLYYDDPYVDRYYNGRYAGFSVRCLRGETGGGSTSQTLPAVTTGNVSDVTLNSAVCGGEVTADGGAEVTERGVCWSTEPSPTVDGSHTTDGTGIGAFSSSITGLTAGTTYYVRTYATNSVGTAYGEAETFTTAEEEHQDTCTIISLPYAEDFESNTASTTTATGVQPDCWELVQEDVAMTDAKRPQLYYKSSFAHSGNYSLLMAYRGVYAMPALSSNIPMNLVKLEMYLRQANAVYQLQVGVWEDNGTFVPVALINNSTTNVEFVEVDFSTYTGSGRKIAFRNVLGGGANYNYSYNYLDDITLSVIGGAVVDEKSCPGTPTVTDHEGNVYATVQIGNQCWMRENLRTKHYADGVAIPAGGSNTSYTEPYYYDYSSHSLPLATRGYLYNWPAAMHSASSSSANPSGVQGICPTGWHLPSDAEWTQLTNYVGSQSEYTCGGSSSNIAKALASETGWNSSTNTCAVGNDPTSNNATGFSAVPAGYCNGSSFINAGNYAYFWSSTQDESNSSYAWYRNLYYASAYVTRGSSSKSYGFSVRCLRD